MLSRVEKDEDGSGASQITFVFDKIFEQRRRLKQGKKIANNDDENGLPIIFLLGTFHLKAESKDSKG